MKANDDSIAVFAAGFCQGWITAYAHSTGSSAVQLSERVSNLLRPIRDGVEDQVSALQGNTTKRIQRIPKVEVVRDAPTRMSKKKVKDYDRRWRNPDGTLMNKEQKHAEQVRRRGNRQAA